MDYNNLKKKNFFFEEEIKIYCHKTFVKLHKNAYIGPNHLLPMELISAAREALSLSRSKPS